MDAEAHCSPEKRGGDDPFKFCPRCGAHGFCQPDARRRRCPACGFEHFINAATAVGAIIERPACGLLFLVRAREPGRGLLALPGGFVDPGESVEDALRREVREESGLELARQEFLMSWPNLYRYGGVAYPTADLFFVAEPVSWDSLVVCEESESLVFVPREEVDLERIAFPSLKAAVARYLASPRLSPSLLATQ